MFAEERPALGPLPLEPFRYYRHGVRTVHLDGCVEVEAAYYSAPPGWIGQRVQVQWDGARVRLLGSPIPGWPTSWRTSGALTGVVQMGADALRALFFVNARCCSRNRTFSIL